jgi:ComEC/Rec2-related protein
MTAAHLQGLPQLLAVAIVIMVVHTVAPKRMDKILAGALCATGFVVELLRILSTPSTPPAMNHVVTTTGSVSGPVRHNGPYWSSDLTLITQGRVRGGLRSRLLLPDSLGTVEEGQIVKVRGRFTSLSRSRNPGEPDWDNALRERGGIGTIWADSMWSLEPATNASHRARVRIRAIIESMISKVIGGKEGALALAVLIGSRDHVDQDTFDNFREAGIIHILAISGLHVLVVVGLLFKLGQLIFPGYRIPALFTVGGLGAYVYLVGPQASVVRAGIMGGTVLLGLVVNRRSDPANSIGLAGLLLLILNPRYLWEPGFQLSFSATLGILLFTPAMLSTLDRVPRPLKWLASAVGASLGAQLGVFPLVVYHFRQWPTYGLITNIPAVLLLTVILWTALVALLIATICPPIAMVLSYGTQVSARALESLAQLTAGMPGALNQWGDIVTWLLAITWCGVMGGSLWQQGRRRAAGAAVGILLGLNGWFLWTVLSPWEIPCERVLVLHVRGGNCLVLEPPGKRLSVIDLGAPGRSRSAFRAAASYLRFRRFHKYHHLLATSTSKYRSGALDLMADEDLVISVTVPQMGAHTNGQRGSPPTIWQEGVGVELGERFRAIPLGAGPNELDGLLIESEGGIRMLVSGENGWKADTRLATRSDVSPVDVLYVGPSRTTGPSHLLLRRVRPGLIVLGDSRRLESGLVDRLLASGYRVACTELGAVIVECRGRTVTWRQWQ